MSKTESEFFKGIRTASPMLLAVSPFGALFGAIAVKNGLSVWEAVLMSMTIFAGASQMVGLELFGGQIAPWLIVLSIFAVNFRHILYSAVVGRYIRHFSKFQRYTSLAFVTDPHFAMIENRVDEGKTITYGWTMGVAALLWVTWVLLTWVGAAFGTLIDDPRAWGIDFLLPIYFLGIVVSFRKRANWLPVVAASGVVAAIAFHFLGSPWHISFGALAGVICAAVLGVPRNHKIAA